MALDELFAGLSRAAESTQRHRIQDLLEEAGILQGSSWAGVRRIGKAGAAAKSRDLSDVKDDIVVKRWGCQASVERGRR